jgi:1-acyl-sn-glycerol-3-phosphate acyltransferase
MVHPGIPISISVLLIPLYWISHRVNFFVKVLIASSVIMAASSIGIPIYLIWVYILKKDENDFQIKYMSLLGPFYSWLFGVKFVTEDNNLVKDAMPCVFVANHQSEFDIIAFLSFMPPRTIVVIKNSVKYIFPLGLFLYLLSNIYINRKDHASSLKGLHQAAKAMKEKKVRKRKKKRNIILFDLIIISFKG